MTCTPDVLDELRLYGDPPADEMLAPLFRIDAPRRFHEVLGDLTHNSQPVPASLPDGLRAWLETEGTLPAWADLDRLGRASQFFVKHAPVISLVLGTTSLIQLYACAKGVKVLAYTGRLWRDPYRRIGQTVQFLLDVMEPNGFSPGGRGIRSIQKVRLMHSAIRNLIWETGEWDEQELGRPINQEELLGTLMTFSHTVCESLKKFHIPVADQEAEDFLYFWRIVGEMLGIRPEILPSTMAEAGAVADMIFSRQQAPSPEGAAMTQALLKMYAAHDPTHLMSRLLPAVMRHTAGEQVCDWMQVPKARFGEFLLEEIGDLAARGLAHIGRRLGMWMLTRGAFMMEGKEIAAFEIPGHLRESLSLSTQP